MKEGEVKKRDEKKSEVNPSLGSTVGRRDLMKIGAGVVLTTLASKGAVAKAAEPETPRPAAAPAQQKASPKIASENAGEDWKGIKSGPGYKNDANRLSGNGPMDDTSRMLVDFALGFKESQLTDDNLKGMGTYMIDCLTAIMAGYDQEPSVVLARYGKMVQGDLKSTVFGHGIITSPEAAAFANSTMIRECDYNDAGPGSHASDIIPGILAVAEAVHATGAQTLAAIAVGIEVIAALGKAEQKPERDRLFDTRYAGISTALGAGRLLGLDADRLANALSIAIVPQIPLDVSHTGALSHFKTCHQPWSVQGGVLAARLAKLGLTGPAQPFEERGGVFDSITGPYKGLKLPISSDGKLNAGYMNFKRFPCDNNTQGLLHQTAPAIRQWAKVEEIESIQVEYPFGHWQENADPPKWDPRNRETADHSMPYVFSVAITDGEVYLDAFTPKKRYVEDQAIRDLMNRITVVANPEFEDLYYRSRTTVRKKSGEQMVKDVTQYVPVTHDDVMAKFKRVCAFKGVSDERHDKLLAAWSKLQDAHDIAEPIRLMAKFGRPVAL